MGFFEKARINAKVRAIEEAEARRALEAKNRALQVAKTLSAAADWILERWMEEAKPIDINYWNQRFGALVGPFSPTGMAGFPCRMSSDELRAFKANQESLKGEFPTTTLATSQVYGAFVLSFGEVNIQPARGGFTEGERLGQKWVVLGAEPGNFIVFPKWSR